MIPIKSARDLQKMSQAGSVLSNVVRNLIREIKPGIKTIDIDRIAQELITKQGAIPAFKNYKGFPASVCISVNEEVVHGIPDERTFELGDIVSLDVGLSLDGYYSDTAQTLAIGRVEAKRNELIEVTKKALYLGIEQARENNHLFDISHAIQNYVEARGFSVVRQFVGHGIGTKMHEEPEIPNFGLANQGPRLSAGMVLAIEPMVNMGTWEVDIKENGWTAVTKDGLPSAHFEHTVAVTENGPQILTQ